MTDTAVQLAPVESATEPGVTFPTDTPALDLFLIRHRLWILCALTLLGGAMRFSFLDRPILWGDEGLTFSRICGNFRQMLDALVYDGFPPLHYEAYWAIGQITSLTPRAMRLIPATAGTLMIPVMYFLAAQMVRRQTALLAATFTCFSAYMMVYSRDAKMYMACWMFMSLNVACLLWWLRSSLRIAWLAWIASGLAMAGMQLSALTIMAIEPVMLLTMLATRQLPHRRWRYIALFLIGALVIGSGAAGYKLGFNRWDQQVTELGFASGSGIGWVEQYNKGRTGPDLILSATTAHLFSWEWPLKATHFADIGIDARTMHGFMGFGVGLLTLMVIGAVSGRSGFRRLANKSPTEPPAASWSSSLWLSLWIVIPAYAMYCVSMREFASPVDWAQVVIEFLSRSGLRYILGVAIGTVILGLVGVRWRYITLAAMTSLFGAAALWLGKVIFVDCIQTRFPGSPPADLWHVLTHWWDGVCTPRAMVFAIGLLVLVAWQTSAIGWTDRCKTAAATVSLVAILLLACTGAYAGVRYHFDQLVAETTLEHHMAPQWEMLAQRSVNDHGIPARETATRQVAEEFLKLDKEQIDIRAATIIAKKSQQWDRLFAAAQKADPARSNVEVTRIVSERLASESVVWDRWVSVWMPRYVGMCWPAVAIAACALLLRLPTWPLRGMAIALLLTVNIIQSAARIFVPTEPPLERIFADAAAGQTPSTRTYFNRMNPPNMGHPGMLGIFGMAGRYYLTQSARKPITPEQFYLFESFFPRDRVPWGAWKFTFLLDESPSRITEELRTSTAITRAIFWEPIDDRNGSGSIAESTARLLGDDWKLNSDERFIGRYHWTWEKLYTVRRREYLRIPKPTSQF